MRDTSAVSHVAPARVTPPIQPIVLDVVGIQSKRELIHVAVDVLGTPTMVGAEIAALEHGSDILNAVCDTGTYFFYPLPE